MKVDTRTTGVGELEKRLQAFEELYGVPSESMVEAFKVDGRLQETSELRRWSRMFRSYKAALRALEARTS